MNRTTLSLLFFMMISWSQAQQTINATIQHDGLTRDYILYVPASYSPGTSVPLLLAFHGYTSSANTLMMYSSFNDVADTANFIVAYPQGTVFNGNTHWNVGGWITGSTVDDVSFTDALLDTIIAGYSIDEDRIYSTGMSNGGYMSFLLACQLSSRIAAVASVTGSMTTTTFDACSPSHPTPILQIHGTVDATVPYAGNALWTKSIDDVLTYWSGHNVCGAPQTSPVPDIAPTDGSTVEHIVYSDGTNCVSVEHFKVTGGDHEWPGVWGNMDIDATAEVWKFLSRYDINGKIDCAGVGLEEPTSNFIEFYPNPAQNKIFVKNTTQETLDYKLYSANGILVKRGPITPGEHPINLSSLAPGVYYIGLQDQLEKLIIKRAK